jgi:hypothetical protein
LSASKLIFVQRQRLTDNFSSADPPSPSSLVWLKFTSSTEAEDDVLVMSVYGIHVGHSDITFTAKIASAGMRNSIE